MQFFWTAALCHALSWPRILDAHGRVGLAASPARRTAFHGDVVARMLVVILASGAVHMSAQGRVSEDETWTAS